MDNTADTWQHRADRALTTAIRYGTRLDGDGDGCSPMVAALADLATACMQRARIAAAAECRTCEGAGVVPNRDGFASCPNVVTHQSL